LLLMCCEEGKERVIDVSLEIPDKLRELQIKLYRKAKNEPEIRVCLLYDKDVESEGVREWLNTLGKRPA
jgi:hypothetical protein